METSDQLGVASGTQCALRDVRCHASAAQPAASDRPERQTACAEARHEPENEWCGYAEGGARGVVREERRMGAARVIEGCRGVSTSTGVKTAAGTTIGDALSSLVSDEPLPQIPLSGARVGSEREHASRRLAG